jgi:ribose transport system substrate-binding protein
MKKVMLVLLVTVMVFSLSACGNPEQTERPVLGIVMPNATHGFLGESIRHAELAAQEMSEIYGVDFEFLTSGSAEEQNSQLNDLIDNKVDAIVLWPHTGGDLRNAAVRAREANIPLVIYDRLITGFEPDIEIMGDNIRIGQMAGEYFNRFFEDEPGDIYYLEFRGDDSTVPEQRSGGFNQTKDARFVRAGEFYTNWQRSVAMELMEEFLEVSSVSEIEKIQAIYTHDDEVALGVLDAIKAYDGDATLNIRLISGVSGSREYLDTFAPVNEQFGISQVTYEFSPSMIRQAIETGMRILNGENISGRILIPTYEIDNTNEEEYRSSDVYIIRYSLD